MYIASLRRRQAKAVRRHRAGAGIPQGSQGKERNLMKRKASVSHDEAIIRRLRKDPEFAAESLKAAGIERESLYRALSVHGKPRLSTLGAVTKAIGLRLTVEAAQ